MLKNMTAFVGAIAVALGFASVSHAQNQPAKPIRVLLVCGGCCHDYAKQKDILAKGIAERANVEVTIAYDPGEKGVAPQGKLNPVYNSDDWAKNFDVVIHDECTDAVTNPTIINRIMKPHKEGLPGVVLHCGMHCYRTADWNKKGGVTPWFEFTGLQTTGHGAQLPIALHFVDTDSPITKGMQDWTTVNEELYNNYNDGKLFDTAKPLVRGKQTTKARNGTERTDDNVVAWTNQYNGKTRVFATTIGHNNKTVADPRYLDMVTRGLLWATNHITDDGKPAPGYEPVKK
jgi:type 1 glutamine amidotransferase